MQSHPFQTGLRRLTLMALTRWTRDRQVMRDCRRGVWDRTRGMNEVEGREMLKVFVIVWFVRLCVQGRMRWLAMGWGGSKRMIETSNQSHCRVERPSRRLLPVVTLLSVQSFFLIYKLLSFFFHMINMSGMWLGGSGAHWNSLIHCVITCAVSKYTAQRRERIQSLPCCMGDWVVYFH